MYNLAEGRLKADPRALFSSISALSPQAIELACDLPYPRSILQCIKVHRVAGKIFFDLQASNGETLTGEFVAGRMPVKGEGMRCTRRTGAYFVVELVPDVVQLGQAPHATPVSKAEQVLALCGSLGYTEM
ncbi:unnamed protein product [Peniophora sp. CBMAI 1063]|nr:unnamed protein product [Peniophora sp. CBMAI 1063]